MLLEGVEALFKRVSIETAKSVLCPSRTASSRKASSG
jgi:hypothetical protein